MNRENLLKLATYLLSGKLEADFDMGSFTDGSDWRFNRRLDCGTVGCAIGHGPYAGLPKQDDEGWIAYSNRVFGFISEPYLYGPNTYHTQGNYWHWCFSSLWDDIDNTPEGAAKRILYLLHNSHLQVMPDISIASVSLYENESL